MKKNKKIKYDKKLKPLLLRLEETLNCISSEEDLDKVNFLIGKYTKNISRYNREEFYYNLNSKTINPESLPRETILNLEDIENGKRLVKRLKQFLSIPFYGTERYYHNLYEVMDTEYEIISKYYKNKKND